MAPAERKSYIGAIRVGYPRWNAILAAIQAAFDENPFFDEPQCLLLVGPTGAGKTTLASTFRAQYQPTDLGERVHHPVLMAKIHAPATINGLAMTMLKTLGDPFYARGTIAEKGERLRDFIHDCQVEMLILDELQHFWDTDSKKVLETVANWLKDLIKDTSVACVLMGLENQAEAVVKANDQLNGLFGTPKVLAPFCWEVADPDTIKEFRTFLEKLDELLPLRERSGLDERELAWRCFVASRGVMRYIMSLVGRATILALTRGCERLDERLLAEAFDSRLRQVVPDVLNPFRGASPALPPPPGRQPSGMPGGRRSRRREQPRETLADVL